MATIQENFNEWKSWTFEHNNTPKRHSDDREEDLLAARMSVIISKLRKNDKHNPILGEYEAICNVYRTGYITRKKRRIPFDIWKEWCELHDRLPRTTSQDKEEVKIACAISKSIGRMQENDTDGLIIQEYYKIRGYYRSKAKAERCVELLQILKQWCKEHGRLPNYKSLDAEEKELAIKIRNVYYAARKKSSFYSEFLTEYDNIVTLYRRRNDGT